MIKKVAKKLRTHLLRIYWQPYYAMFCKIYGKKNVVVCECYVKYGFLSVKKNNWGDDLNCYLFKLISNKSLFFLPYSKVGIPQNEPCYSLIGSIVSFYDLNHKYIYGSGIMNPHCEIRGIPDKIFSVRGPKTREVLRKAGIDCPEKYGDPALLLPMFYQPSIKKNNKVVIIPNMGSYDDSDEIIQKLAQRCAGEILDLRNYEKWTDIIDTIAGASIVISESLHGLIVAETYGIPCVWVEFKKHPDYWNFKYEDFYESIEKYCEKSLKLNDKMDIQEIFSVAKRWRKGNINYKKLLEYYPFEYVLSKEKMSNG